MSLHRLHALLGLLAAAFLLAACEPAPEEPVVRRIVEPVDDFRDSNPPSNPALLDAITAEFVRGGMRLRPLVALVMKSKTYCSS